MIALKHILAVIGFAFVAAWIAFNFGYAVLCLVGAGVFYGVGTLLSGEVQLADLQARVGNSAPAPSGRVR